MHRNMIAIILRSAIAGSSLDVSDSPVCSRCLTLQYRGVVCAPGVVKSLRCGFDQYLKPAPRRRRAKSSTPVMKLDASLARNTAALPTSRGSAGPPSGFPSPLTWPQRQPCRLLTLTKPSSETRCRPLRLRLSICRQLRRLSLGFTAYPRLGCAVAWGYHSVRQLRRLVGCFLPT